MTPVAFPSAPSQMPPKSPYRLHMDTRSGWSAPKHDGFGRLVFCQWLFVAGDKQGSNAFHLEPVNITRLSIKTVQRKV